MCSPEEMASMTDIDPTRSAPPEEESAPWARPEPGTAQAADDPGYLTETGQAAGEDGSVVPIIGGLPAVEGAAWGGAWATRRAGARHRASQEDRRGSG